MLALDTDLIMTEEKARRKRRTLRAKWIPAARAKAATFDAELIPSRNQLEGAILQKCRVLSEPRQERVSTLVFATGGSFRKSQHLGG